MSDRIILHCDLNGFFASVECLLNPLLADVPIAVCGDPTRRHGIILAKNEKAKAFGIVTAETIWSAKQKCPDLTLVSPHREEYERYSRLCNEIYLRYTDLVEPFGIDESYLDVTGSVHLFGDGVTIADDIRRTIRQELGLTVSVGVSFNKIFAKLGSDYKKPDATTVISREHGKKIVFPLPANALLFVGKKTNEMLAQYGIHTIGDIAHSDRGVLEGLLGSAGAQIHDYAIGKDDSPVASFYTKEEVKSVGNGTTFEYDVTEYDDLKPRIAELCESVAARLRHKHLKCATLQVSVKTPEFKTTNHQKPIQPPANLTRDITRAALDLIEQHWKPGSPVRLVTITASKLVPESEAVEQLSLFTDVSEREKQEALQSTVDSIRDKYGWNSIDMGAKKKR